jgi:CheY-like chemotaxis protein
MARSHSPLALIMDDDVAHRRACAAWLSSAGFRVTEVSSPSRVVRLAAKLAPDVIVLDRGLPDLDGWETAREIKRRRATASIPIIALTANVFYPSVEGSLLAGCDAFLAKPFEPRALVALARACARDRLKAPAAPAKVNSRPAGRPAARRAR